MQAVGQDDGAGQELLCSGQQLIEGDRVELLEGGGIVCRSGPQEGSLPGTQQETGEQLGLLCGGDLSGSLALPDDPSKPLHPLRESCGQILADGSAVVGQLAREIAQHAAPPAPGGDELVAQRREVLLQSLEGRKLGLEKQVSRLRGGIPVERLDGEILLPLEVVVELPLGDSRRPGDVLDAAAVEAVPMELFQGRLDDVFTNAGSSHPRLI